MRQDIDSLAIRAAQDEETRSELVLAQERFILRTASKAAYKFITKSDDEWSAALIAFSHAIDTYDLGKGAFLPYAALVIKRRVTDNYRLDSRHSQEVSVDPYVFTGEMDEESPDAGLQFAVMQRTAFAPDRTIADEIDAANQLFSEYGFTFFDLTECSPQRGKTKTQCAKAIAALLDTPLLLSEMRVKRLLPINAIIKITGIPRKVLERHRKYIIAAAEILSRDYPALADYLSFVRREAGT